MLASKLPNYDMPKIEKTACINTTVFSALEEIQTTNLPVCSLNSQLKNMCCNNCITI